LYRHVPDRGDRAVRRQLDPEGSHERRDDQHQFRQGKRRDRRSKPPVAGRRY